MYRLKILPYTMGSESAKDLAKLLNVLRVHSDGDYVPKLGNKVINWGSSKAPTWADIAARRSVTILNKPSAVNIASNKLTAFQALQRAGVRIPEFTTNINLAQRWLVGHDTVVERHELRGNSGEGIRIVTLDDDEMEGIIQSAPLYTKFIPKTAEFRVHIFQGQVIDYIEKKKLAADRRPEHFNKYISSTEFGWVFARTDVRDIPEVRALALKAVAALGLDFGAVDVVYCDGLPYVLEVNTAPGLAGTTLVKYANALRRFMGQPDLPSTVTSSVMDQVPVPSARITATTALDNSLQEMVTLRIDKATALKLKSLLASI